MDVYRPDLYEKDFVSLELDYLLERSRKRKKTISLQLRKDGSIVIQSPYGIPTSKIDDFFRRKKNWLKKKIEEKDNQAAVIKPKDFLPGETFLYLGYAYPLILRNDDPRFHPLTFSGHQFILETESLHQARHLFVEWYKERAREYIEEKILHYGGTMQLYPVHVRIGSAGSRWGSCSPDNRLSFTWRLMMAPCTVIDYVVVHELAHIREKNHSNRFWNLLDNAIPDYKRCRLWLRGNGHLLNI